MGKYVNERHIDGDDENNAILAHLVDCHDPARNVSIKRTKQTQWFDVAFNSFYSTAKSR